MATKRQHEDDTMDTSSSSEDEEYDPKKDGEDIGSTDEEEEEEDEGEDYYMEEDGTVVTDVDALHQRDAEAFLELDKVLRGMGLRKRWAPAYVENLRSSAKTKKDDK